MSTFSYTSTVPRSQWIALAIFGAILTVGIVVIGSILSGFFPYEPSMQAFVVSVCFGVGTGYAARYSFLRGWRVAIADRHFGDAVSTMTTPKWPGKRTFGIVWRALASYLMGHWILTSLVTAADSETGMIAGMVLGTAIMVGLAVLMGVRYGYTQNLSEAELAVAALSEG